MEQHRDAGLDVTNSLAEMPEAMITDEAALLLFSEKEDKLCSFSENPNTTPIVESCGESERGPISHYSDETWDTEECSSKEDDYSSFDESCEQSSISGSDTAAAPA